MPRASRRLIALCLALTVAVLDAGAAEAERTLVFAWSVGRLAGDAWQVEGASVRLEVGPDNLGTLVLEAAALRVDGVAQPVEGLRIACPRLEIALPRWACLEGRLTVSSSALGRDHAGGWTARSDADGMEVTVEALDLAGGRVDLGLATADGRWRATAEAAGLVLDAVLPLFGGLPGIEPGLSGRLAGSLEAVGTGALAERLSAAVGADAVAFASTDGLRAAEGLGATLSLQLETSPAGWRGEAVARADRGELYVDPVYLDLAATPIETHCQGYWSVGAQRAGCRDWEIDQPGVARVEGSLDWDLGSARLEALTAKLAARAAGELYRLWLRPFVIGTPADEAAVAGELDLELAADGAGLSAFGLTLRGLDLDGAGGKAALRGLHGAVGWTRTGPPRSSAVRVEGGTAFGIAIQGFDVAFSAAGDRVELLSPLAIPLLGGALRVDRLTFAAGDQGPVWETSVVLERLSLEALTAALDWPPFGGTVEGHLPGVKFEDGTLSTSGVLTFDVFDGQVDLSGLRLRDPLGAAPVLSGGARIRSLDLALLTQAFAFGRIEGRMDGELEGLELVGWQPNRFRLHLYTPGQAPGRRRISQRAVENLTELGSGVPAGLSSTFLQLFDDFRYEAIDLTVALDGNLALLSGIARPDGGYYLVKGAGLPRIDVIGRNREVAWKELVQRLRDIRLEGVTID